jgi:site-specific recombinase XerD
VQKRNKVLLSLVIFQGVGSKELNLIELKDLDLMNGKIYVPGARTTNGRTLDLKAQQLLLFQDYMLNVRPVILKEANKSSDYFLVNSGQGKDLLTNVISLLLRKLRPNYPKLKSLQQIRQSVLTEWLKQYGLRKTQYMAGHRYVSSTERYNVDRMEGLKKELKTHYLLGK